MHLFGVKLLGVNAQTGKKLVLTLALIAIVFVVRFAAKWLLERDARHTRFWFWVRQAISILLAIVLIGGLASIWFEDPRRLSTAVGLIAAGLTFALQKVVTSVAGYFVILRGKTFNVGDRITMGGVRGDVVALSLIRTTIMEMGQPADIEEQAKPAMWVHGRQYTGRIVTVTNDKIFDEPVYNYTREFPYLWDEMHIPIKYTADRERAEDILLEAARRHTVQFRSLGEEALRELERRYFIRRTDFGPRVYYRLTDNWLELTLRFLTRDAGMRAIKDALSRDILDGFEDAGIDIASGTYDIVGLPPVRVQLPREPGLAHDGQEVRE